MHHFSKTLKLSVSLLVTFLCCGLATAQSGRSVMKGYVAFENIAYVDKQPRAKVELCAEPNGKHCGANTETDEHGFYEMNSAALGELWLRISASGFETYEIRIYLPSDFIGNLAVLMKRVNNKKTSSRKQVRSRSTLTLVGGANKNYVSKH